MKNRSLLVLCSVASLSVATSACTYDDGMHGSCAGPNCYPTEQPGEVQKSSIDTGATLADIVPGQGAGTFVEYETGGKWHVFTACDTAISGLPCRWDIIVSVGAGAELTDFQPEELESADYLDWRTKKGVRMVAENSLDFDGFTLEATPEATLRVDVYLDDAPAPAYLYWVGSGGLHQGAPSNPLDLTPSTP
ncbi:MAG: hypothetical protein IPI67_20515 [Myxococcales bacterium]|nr:hypothetical protein [Myxococcales bacterium]